MIEDSMKNKDAGAIKKAVEHRTYLNFAPRCLGSHKSLLFYKKYAFQITRELQVPFESHFRPAKKQHCMTLQPYLFRSAIFIDFLLPISLVLLIESPFLMTDPPLPSVPLIAYVRLIDPDVLSDADCPFVTQTITLIRSTSMWPLIHAFKGSRSHFWLSFAT